MNGFVATKYYALEQPELLAETQVHIQKQNEILNAFQEFKKKYNADFIQFRDSISRGISFMGLCYLESNLDKIDKTKFKISKPFPSTDQNGNMVKVVRAVARFNFKEGLRIEAMRYSYNDLCKLLVAQGYLVSMVAPADGSPLYYEVKGIGVDVAREITGSEYEELYNINNKETGE